jgi:hypothetical protein
MIIMVTDATPSLRSRWCAPVDVTPCAWCEPVSMLMVLQSMVDEKMDAAAAAPPWCCGRSPSDLSHSERFLSPNEQLVDRP